MLALDIVEVATKAGTLPMQVLLLVGMIILGLALRYVYRENMRQREVLHEENRSTIETFTKRIDAKENAISAERIARINMLMDRIGEDTKVKAKMEAALEANTDVIQEFIRTQKEMLNELKHFIIGQTGVITALCDENRRRRGQ